MLDKERIHELIDDEVGEVDCHEKYNRLVAIIEWVYEQGREEGIADYIEKNHSTDESEWERTR